MQERHQNRKMYFDEQAYTTQKYVIPFIECSRPVNSDSKILEIGCGEGGNLKPFMDLGCQCVGIDLNKQQIENAKEYFSTHSNHAKLELISSDIYDINNPDFRFNVIILRDVIEHIHDQERFMAFVKQFLLLDGVVFFAFPPWYMPFGGHQQICQSKISKIPYIHILPRTCYAALLKSFGETARNIEGLLEIKETGITLDRFERILKRESYSILKKELYFINPNYEIKFKLRPRKMFPVIDSIPFIRNFYTTAGYYLVQVIK